MVVQSYDECFWGGDLNNTQGYERLTKRNHDSKKMCQELEDYLKKRAKLESEFSKSLSNLTKCFKYREQVGQLEEALNHFRNELDSMATSHHGASVFFSNQADAMKSFRDEQNVKMKQLEEQLLKAQNTKLNQLTQTRRLEKTYTKKCLDRDVAQNSLKEIERESSQAKETDKAKSRLMKAEEEAQKADNGYRSGVIVLESTSAAWERMMEKACQIVQELDENRVRYLRQELWISVNVDSKLSLDVDNCCESVRHKLEKCDVIEDIQKFIKAAGTGTVRPKRYSFKHYTRMIEIDSDADSSSSIDNNDNEKASGKATTSGASTQQKKNIFSKMKNPRKL